jgi:hypothetical protein
MEVSKQQADPIEDSGTKGPRFLNEEEHSTFDIERSKSRPAFLQIAHPITDGRRLKTED